MLYNIDFDIAATILSVVIVFYMLEKKGLKTVTNRIFLLVMITNIITALSDILSSVENSYHLPDRIWLQDLWNYVYLVFHNIMPLLFLFYTLYLLGIGKTMRKRTFFLISIPLMIDLILLALNPFFREIFYYDENGLYTHGTVFIVFWIIAIGYMIAVMVLIICYKRNLTRSKYYPLLFFLVMQVGSLLFQISFPYILVEIFTQTIGFMGVLYSIENRDDIINHSTGVLNRYAFLEAATPAFHRKRRSFIIIKLSNLSYYNMTVGVEQTNAFLREIAAWLEKLDPRMLCYDCTGGHFVLLGEGVGKDEMKDLCGQILDRFENRWGKGSVHMLFPVQVCFGRFMEDVESLEDLMLVIDSPYDESFGERVKISKIVETNKRRLLLESLITEALQNGGFRVFYQPIWERKSNRFHSAEALIRLTNGEYGFISPEEFIPVAEKSGQIDKIGEFVFEQVCRFYKTKQLDKYGVDYIEVNLSTVQCMNTELTKTFRQILRKYDLPSKRINLEITESAAAKNRMELKKNVESLREMGFTFSLDDYGTGYSNYSYMFEMPFGIIKLDKSILWNALDPKGGTGDRNCGILLSNTIHMMKDMKYTVLVEGVETVEQKMLLEDLGCDYLQGFFFSKPVPEEVFLEYVKVVNS